ncbi:MAG TPA: hypothetical protein EYH49_00420 [Aquifex aeolicus]|nr:hypothetical protein [Aquifex aeolicus]
MTIGPEPIMSIFFMSFLFGIKDDIIEKNKVVGGKGMKRVLSLIPVIGLVGAAVFSQSCASKSEVDALKSEIEALKKETEQIKKETEELKKEAREVKDMAEEISRKIEEHASDRSLHPGLQ